MATPVAITIDNYATYLVESDNPRGSAPNGNVYFDVGNDEIQLITAEEDDTIIYPATHPNFDAGAEGANPLTNILGVTAQALYAFERERRGNNANLRKFLPGVDGNYQYAGAFVFDNGVKLSTGGSISDRLKIRGSGWVEKSATGTLDRIYFGVRSLNNIEATSQAYYQIADSLSEADLQAAVPVAFQRLGPVDEAIQVFGSATEGNLDYRTKFLVPKIRTFGYTQGETNSAASGVSTLHGFSAGFGFGEAVSHLGTFTLADVYTTPVTPFDAMTYESLDTPASRTGFSGGAANFSDVINTGSGGTLAQIRAFLDALMQDDTDKDINVGATFYPKRADPLYTINSAGKLVTRQGLWFSVPTSDQQSVIFTDDAGAETYPFQVELRIGVSDAWVADANAWGTLFYVTGGAGEDYGTTSAVIVQDASDTDITTSTADEGAPGSWEIVRTYDFDGNTQAGLNAGDPKTVIFLAEGDGTAQAASVTFTITRQATVSASAQSEAETNI